MVVQRIDPRIAPPCTDDDSTTGPCGPAAKCLQCKKTARILLDQAAVGRWDTVMNALRAWPKLVNYEPEFEEGHKTLVSVATPLYEGGPPKAPPPFAPCSAHAWPRTLPHPLRTRSTRSAPAPCTLRARSVHALQVKSKGPNGQNIPPRGPPAVLLEDHMQGATAPPPKGLDAKGQERYWAQRSDYALLHWAAPRAGSRGGRHACAALGSFCSDCESLQAPALALGRSGAAGDGQRLRTRGSGPWRRRERRSLAGAGSARAAI